ncbi:hypothetical protein CASFOL_030779 [Castilleja foliolosa]|uniref:U1-type domain-containing protein n=1 Tax=Castilleja foliolosa TaxID=1961234 RepID=A0ABD3C6B3_9LAMI
MVWFQCEDCGDNLKKPKLANHFRQCSAFKLSCIDCGQVFGQQDVESHTQCITEAEKYGPKDQDKATNGSNTKSKSETKQKPEVDINVGLSERPPWLCSLCNTSATSKQTLLAHADGKKHRAKARAFHASKQPPNDTANTKNPSEIIAKDEVTENKDSGESKDQNPSEVENKASESRKKRKPEASENDISSELGNGEENSKKAKHSVNQENEEVGPIADKDPAEKKINWEKLITEALKSTGDREIHFKKLCKFAVKYLRESGFTVKKPNVTAMLKLNVNSNSKFIVDGKKNISLAASSQE